MDSRFSKSYLSFFYFGSAVLGALVGTLYKFPPLLILLPIFVFSILKNTRLSLFIAIFIFTNLVVINDVEIKDAQFVGIVKSVQEGSSTVGLKYYDGNKWRNLGFDVRIYKEEKIGTIVYFIGELKKTNSYPRYYAKTTLYATSTNYSPVSLVYNTFESFRAFSATVNPFYQNLFGNQTKDEYFIKSGLFHIFCVSGIHVSILYLFSYYIVSLFTYRKLLRKTFSLIFPTIFVIGSGMNVPSIRALLMLLFSSIFLIIDYKINPINTVSLVGLFMVLFNPEIVFSLSFYMTFFATIGVLSATNNLFANIGGFLGSAPYVSLISPVNAFSILATLIVSFPVQIVMFGLTISYIFFIVKLPFLSSFILYALLPFSWFIQLIAYTFSKFPLIPQSIVITIAFSLTYIIYLALMQEFQKENNIDV